MNVQINGLVQDCSISIANAQEILQSCTKPSIYDFKKITKTFVHFVGPYLYIYYSLSYDVFHTQMQRNGIGATNCDNIHVASINQLSYKK